MKDSRSLLVRRIIMSTVGQLLAGVSVGLLKRAFFGIDPFQCFVTGISNVVPIGYGTLYVIINAVLLVVVFFLDKRFIGISTMINLFLLGYVVEFTVYALTALFGMPGIVLRLALFIIGLVLSCIAAALYYSADLGVTTYDAIPLHIASLKPHLFRHELPFKVVRIISDLICVIIGVLLGAQIGVGTVIIALFMGPLITYFKRTISDPLVAR